MAKRSPATEETPLDKPPVSRGSNPEKARAFAVEAARMLADDKCEDIVLLDVRELSQVTDFIVIGTGTSERQMRSVLHHVEDLGAELGFSAYRSSADERATWLLADFVDVVVHVFEPNTRAHYDLEMLWGDATRLEWARPEGATPRGKR
jgi:ribosome-associated protein